MVLYSLQQSINQLFKFFSLFELYVFLRYGHADIIIEKNAYQDFFHTLI